MSALKTCFSIYSGMGHCLPGIMCEYLYVIMVLALVKKICPGYLIRFLQQNQRVMDLDLQPVIPLSNVMTGILMLSRKSGLERYFIFICLLFQNMLTTMILKGLFYIKEVDCLS